MAIKTRRADNKPNPQLINAQIYRALRHDIMNLVSSKTSKCDNKKLPQANAVFKKIFGVNKLATNIIDHKKDTDYNRIIDKIGASNYSKFIKMMADREATRDTINAAIDSYIKIESDNSITPREVEKYQKLIKKYTNTIRKIYKIKPVSKSGDITLSEGKRILKALENKFYDEYDEYDEYDSEYKIDRREYYYGSELSTLLQSLEGRDDEDDDYSARHYYDDEDDDDDEEYENIRNRNHNHYDECDEMRQQIGEIANYRIDKISSNVINPLKMQIQDLTKNVSELSNIVTMMAMDNQRQQNVTTNHIPHSGSIPTPVVDTTTATNQDPEIMSTLNALARGITSLAKAQKAQDAKMLSLNKILGNIVENVYTSDDDNYDDEDADADVYDTDDDDDLGERITTADVMKIMAAQNENEQVITAASQTNVDSGYIPHQQGLRSAIRSDN